MISKLPRWVWAGGAALAFSAGMVNAIAILGFAHEAATHVTGFFSRLGIGAASGDSSETGGALAILGSFFAGAVLCGTILRNAQLKMGRRYGLALAIESGILFGAAYGFWRGSLWGEYLACAAAGLQNAMVSTYSGAIVRTTHLTGVLTDLGVTVGHWITGADRDFRRMKLLSILIVSFTAGSFAGALLYARFESLAMLGPAILIGLAAAGYTWLRGHYRRREKAFPQSSTRVHGDKGVFG